MSYVGKVCPYCKSEFKEDDDVVICSVCEMPHHKECWIENKACTTFGCTGTIMNTSNNSNSLFCEKCGLVCFKGEAFCSACGNPLLQPEEQPQYAYSSVQQQAMSYNQSQYSNQTQRVNYEGPNAALNPNEDVLTFIGVNQEYYFNKFQKFDLNNSKVSWNWASAFLGGYWYAYRKMFLFQFLYYVIYIFIVGFLGILLLGMFAGTTRNTHTGFAAVLHLLVLFGPFLLSGMFGNIIYKYHAEQHLSKARHIDAYLKKNYLIKKGGTSKTAVWVLIGIDILLRTIGN